ELVAGGEHHALGRPRGDALAVGRERHAPDRASVPLEGERLLSGVRVPDLHRLVPAARGDALAVSGERHALDRTRVTLDGELNLSGPHVPHLHLAPDLAQVKLPTHRGDAFPVRGDRQARLGANLFYYHALPVRGDRQARIDAGVSLERDVPALELACPIIP